MLRLLAEARGAEVSDRAYELYAESLSGYEEPDVLKVVDTLAKRKRGEFEKPWPALGDFIDPLDRLKERRYEQRRQERQQQEGIELFWKIAAERLEMHGVFNFNGVPYHSLDEVNSAPTQYKGTRPR
jgi:hypothetical protein